MQLLGHTLPLVLLAEDDADDTFFMQRAFAHSAIPSRLFVVTDGFEAVNYLHGKGQYADRQIYPLPGLLLLDLKMPGMNGFEVLEWLRGRSPFNELPIVTLSGSSLEADMQRAKELGADEYRVKSSDIVYLVKMLHELHARWLAPQQRWPLTHVPASLTNLAISQLPRSVR